jgi:geranylgeranyl pyrophosphate synthase
VNHSEGVVEHLQRLLIRPIAEFLERPGKRIRAQLVGLGFELANNPAANATGMSCLCDFIEKLHAGSLIIDDIQDQAQSRRGRQSLHVKFGVPVSINMGNWLYFSGLEHLAQIPLPQDKRCEVLERAIAVTRQCHEGQALDLALTIDSLPQVDVPEVVATITAWKTESLTGLAAWLGAYVAGGDLERCRGIGEFGRRLGSVLQIQNDFTELQQVAKQTRVSQDFANRRVTWPWAWAASRLPDDDYQTLLRSLWSDEIESQSGLAQRLLDQTSQMARTEIKERLSAAALQIDAWSVSPQQRHQMAQLLSNLELRYA